MDADIYQKMRSLEESHWWFVARRHYIERLIQRCVQPSETARFCEVGAGTGGNLALLTRYATTDAIEYETDAVAIIRQRQIPGVGEVSQGSLPDHLPFTNQYDGVFALDVVEHVEDDRAAMEAIASLVGKDGKLILTVPAYQWLWSGHDVANRHFRRYTRNQIVSLIQASGLTVSFASYFNTLLFPLKLAQHLKENILPPKESEWQVSMPPDWMNRLFTQAFGLERHASGRIAMPFGLSIAVVAKKNNG